MNVANQLNFEKNFAKLIVDMTNINQFDKKDIKDKIDLFYEAYKFGLYIRYYNQQQQNQYYLMNNQNYSLNNNYFKY